jgi:ferritin-like metal-binding protein YciE
MDGLRGLLLEELGGVLHVENLLMKWLPRFALAADSKDLKKAFDLQLAQTKKHLARLQSVFKMFDQIPREKKCDPMLALLMEAKRMMEKLKRSPLRDAALICNVQKMQHHQVVAYTALCSWADTLKEEDACDLLEETLDEEELANKRLTEIASRPLSLQEVAV